MKKRTSRIKTVLANALEAYNQPPPEPRQQKAEIQTWQKEREAEQAKLISKINEK